MLILFVVMLGGLISTDSAPPPEAGSPEAVTQDGSRVVHTFHFDERPEGNLEDLPRYWEPLRLIGFPRFAVGALDEKVGHLTPCSFHLASNGRNVAFQYAGPETRVREATDYRVVGHLRPDRLENARTCLSACYLDRKRRPLLNTLVRSRWIGEARDKADWVKVELFLPPAPAEAHTIGLSAWVVQESAWNERASAQRHLSLVNVNAGVWVDDITLYALPLVELSTSARGNILDREDAPHLLIRLADQHDQGLVGELTVQDAAGEEVERQEITATAESAEALTKLNLEGYSPGLYMARLEVRARERVIVTRTLRFAIVASAQRFANSGARTFGLIIDPAQRSLPEVEDRLVRQSGVQALKLPLWSGQADDPLPPETKAAHDRWLQFLLKDGFHLTGVLAGVPAELLRGATPYSRTMLDLLAERPELWNDSLAAVVAPYASTFRAWQVGPDGWSVPFGADKLTTAVGQLATSMQRFVTSPYLVAPLSCELEPVAPQPSFDQLALRIPTTLGPAAIPEVINAWKSVFPGKLSVSLSPLDSGPFDRTARLADFAQRLIAARHAGIDTVYVPQPWTVRTSIHGPITEPTEEYLVIRTLTDLLGEAHPRQHLVLSPTAHLYVFSTGLDAVVAAWDMAAPPQGSIVPLLLGPATRQVDLFGVAQPIEHDANHRHLIRLTAAPTFIDQVDPALIDLFASFAIDPVFYEPGREIRSASLSFKNTSAQSLTGQLVLRAPPDWDIAPRQFDVNLMPHRAQKLDMEVRVTHNSPAGRHVILAELTLSDGRRMDVPLAVDLGLSGIKVQGMAWLDQGDLLIRHEVTNESRSTLHFRGAALVPGRERQYRPINNLAPGDSQRVEYKFRGAAHLAGTGIRLELRETNDGPRTHSLELTVP